MLKPAYLHTTKEELNKLINRSDKTYLTYSSYDRFEIVESLGNDEWSEFQFVSVDENDNVLGFYEFSRNQTANKISSCFFVHFKNEEYYDSEIAKEDFKEAFDLVASNPQVNIIYFTALCDNPANERMYKYLLGQYNGSRFVLPKYARLKDGKIYDAYQYYFDVEEYRLDLGEDE